MPTPVSHPNRPGKDDAVPPLKRCLLMAGSAALVVAIGCEPAKPPAPKDPSAQPRDTLGKYTQNVYDLQEELAKGAVLADLSLKDSDALVGYAGALNPTTAKIGLMSVEQNLNMYYAMNEKYPANLQEFRDEILKVGKPDGVQLPMLTYYREYAYDAPNHKVVVIEYPARKEAREKELNQ
ncbi:MAG: hypothetical protein U0800_03475 [Isosphaeraceae bacterium]